MQRRALLLAVAVVAAAGVVGLGVHARRAGTFSPNAWIRSALVAFADAWLVPKVSVGGFSMDSPTTLALRDVALTAADEEIFRCSRLAVTFRDLPERGQPLTVERVELDAPVLRLIFDADRPGLLPRGLAPLVEPPAEADPSAVGGRLHPRELLDLRLLRIRGGEVHLEDGLHPPLRLDGIDLDLDATPAVSPGGATGHQLSLSLGQEPGFVVTARGFVDLDAGLVDLAEGRLALDLDEPAATAALTEGVRDAVDRLAARGTVEAELTGVVSWREPLASRATFRLDSTGLEGVAGPVRLPGLSLHVLGDVADGRVRLDRAEASVGEGNIVLSRGDVALDDASLALAADWSLEALPLHALVAPGTATESLATGSGRLFVKTGPPAVGLTVSTLTVGERGRPPTVELGPASVRGVVYAPPDDPSGAAAVVVDAIELSRVQVRLAQTPDGVVRGLPLPRRERGQERREPSGSGPVPLRLESLVVDNGALWVDRPAGAWSLTGLGGSLSGLGGDAPAQASLRLSPGEGAKAEGVGTFDLASRRLSLSRLAVTGDLASTGLRSLLPPETRTLVGELVPRGQLEATGTADLAFGSGDTQIVLDTALTEGAARLSGLTLPVSEGSARLVVGGGSVAVERLVLAAARGTLEVDEARLSAGGDLAVQWDARRLDLSRVRTASGLGLGMGRLSTGGRLLGRLAGDQLRQLSVVGASVLVDQGPAGQLRWPSINLTVEDGSSGRAVTGRLAGLPGSQVDLEATWPAGSTELVVRSLTGSLAAVGPGREGLPVFVQRSLDDLEQGTLSAKVSGVLSLEDPIAGSRLSGTVDLAEGSYRWGDWTLPGLEATLPVSLSQGTVSAEEGRLDLLAGSVALTRGRWSLLEDTGTVAARLEGLRLEGLRPAGPAASAIEGRLAGHGSASLRLTEDGLAVTGGRGKVTVREGRLVSLPTLAALTKGAEREGGPGDDAVDLDMVFGVEGVSFRALDLDLGPVRYRGGGTLRWTGGLNLSLEADRSARRLSDLAARLVSWRVGGTTARPTVQALPLGVDTRTFAQKRSAEGVDADALDALDSDALDELETASERSPPSSASTKDEVEFNLDDFDGWK